MSIGKRLVHMLSIDLVVCMTVISIVVVLLGYQARNTKTMIMSVVAAAEVLGELRTPMSTYYAINGEWPADREALQSYLPGKWTGTIADMSDGALIANGAITVRVRRVSPDANMLTLHPAAPAGDPLGPVKWVAGSQSTTDGWTVAGEDHTTFSENKILNMIKQ